jgi:isopentenyl-diphosphate delta-isomerase
VCVSDNVQVPLEAFTYLTRIHYQAKSDATWGEHEIDYILFIQRDVTVAANPNEVKSHRYVSAEELKQLLGEAGQEGGVTITPWFKAIADKFLFEWWQHLDNLSSFQDHQNIHKM